MNRTVAIAFAAVISPMTLWAAVVDLAQIRAAPTKYQVVNVAFADGNINPDNHCVSAEGEGVPPELGRCVAQPSFVRRCGRSENAVVTRISNQIRLVCGLPTDDTRHAFTDEFSRPGGGCKDAGVNAVQQGLDPRRIAKIA